MDELLSSPSGDTSLAVRLIPFAIALQAWLLDGCRMGLIDQTSYEFLWGCLDAAATFEGSLRNHHGSTSYQYYILDYT
ncbi:hypothetical protein [Acidaminococcus sp. AM05-11]|uniref:hypothetical protein n=1 Tax=Acidaminococcus sp. AM05-11 TaxID=2291997 RepID=UPI0018F5E7D7|nr:hypothetical protein [Acidaminococcus sp. AM05-11]